MYGKWRAPPRNFEYPEHLAYVYEMLDNAEDTHAYYRTLGNDTMNRAWDATKEFPSNMYDGEDLTLYTSIITILSLKYSMGEIIKAWNKAVDIEEDLNEQKAKEEDEDDD
jgi:hypothetical protein